MVRHGKPVLQHPSGLAVHGAAFTWKLASNGIATSMDGNGAWRDDVFVERLRCSVNTRRLSAGLRQRVRCPRDQADFNQPKIRMSA